MQRGGTLVQDIATELPGALDHERGSEGDRPVHPVRVEPGSYLWRVVGAQDLEVNSTHHQAVREPGKHVRVAARALDGVIEAIEDAERSFWIGVQWHPERLDDSPGRALVVAFVEAARAYAAARPAHTRPTRES